MVTSHELIESVTDRDVGLATTVGYPLAWYDTAGGEIGDICHQQFATVVGGDGNTYSVQKQWSNKYNACIATAPTDFSMSVSPSSIAINPGATAGPISVATTVLSGTGATAALSLGGVPSGAQATFTPTMVNLGGSSNLVITTTSTVVPGSYPLTISALEDSIIRTASFTLVINAPAGTDFAVAASPTSATIVSGSYKQFTVSTTTTQGVAQQVSLSATSAPSGLAPLLYSSAVTTGASTILSVGGSSATPGSYTVTITATGVTGTKTATIAVNVIPVSDFSLTMTPSSGSLQQGASTTTTVALAVTQGVAQSATLSIGGLPANMTASFSPNTVTTAQSTQLSISAKNTTPPGTYSLSVTAVAASGSRTAYYSITVQQAPGDFSVTLSPMSISVSAGFYAATTLQTALTSGAVQNLRISANVANLPSGTNVLWTPSSFASGDSALVSVGTATWTTPGTYAVTLTVSGGLTSHTATFTVTVLPASDFTIAMSPAQGSVAQGNAISPSVVTTTTKGSGGSISFSTTGLPSYSSVSFSPTQVATGSSETMTITTTPSTPVGSYDVTVTAATGIFSHAAHYTLNVFATNDFSISLSPSSVIVNPGNTTTATITTQVTFGVPQTVTLWAANLPAGVTASFSPTTLTTGGSATVTIAATASAAPGSATAAFGANNSLIERTTHPVVSVLGTGITNGGFENGFLAGWAATGLYDNTDGSRSGNWAATLSNYGAQDATLSQTFVVDAAKPVLSLWYEISCGQGDAKAGVTITATDLTNGVVETVLPTTCGLNGATWQRASAVLTGGHTYQLTITDHDAPTWGSTVDLDDIAMSPTSQPFTNGGFETANFSGWTVLGAPNSGGATATITSPGHTGTSAVRLGLGILDKSISQTFTTDAMTPTLTAWYKANCTSTFAGDGATVTLTDHTTGVTTKPLPTTCTTGQGWKSVSAALTAGHTYTLMLTNASRGTNYLTDYTDFDDVTLTASPLANGGFETGDLTSWVGNDGIDVWATPHSGTYGAVVGANSTETGDATLAQTFANTASDSRLTFWTQQYCAGGTKDTATATITDVNTGKIATVMPAQCGSGPWKQWGWNLVGGHTYTLQFTGHDDPGDGPSYLTLVDDVAIAPAKALTNGGFESVLTGWATTGNVVGTTASHSGRYAAHVTAPAKTDPWVFQQFDNASATSISVWYSITSCLDGVANESAAITLLDQTTASSITVLPPTCTNGQGWKQVSAPLIPGHSYFIVLAGHAAATATHALTVDYDDVVIS
jgi:uncharacterized membrane protein